MLYICVCKFIYVLYVCMGLYSFILYRCSSLYCYILVYNILVVCLSLSLCLYLSLSLALFSSCARAHFISLYWFLFASSLTCLLFSPSSSGITVAFRVSLCPFLFFLDSSAGFSSPAPVGVSSETSTGPDWAYGPDWVYGASWLCGFPSWDGSPT